MATVVGRPLRVLLVENSESDAELGQKELVRSGYDVQAERVDNAADLSRALKSEHWDLVLCDHSVPSFTSSEALALVHAHDDDLPFVILSGTIGEEAAVAALKAGARDVVLKSNLPRLGSVADRELEEATTRRRLREAVAALAESEARRTAMFEAALDAILAVDREGRVGDVNFAAESLLGESRSQLRGRAIDEVLGFADPSRHGGSQPDHDIAALVGKRVELTAQRVDGSSFPAEVSVARGTLGAAPLWTFYVRDLTDAQRAQAENDALEAHLRQAQKTDAMGRLAGGITHDFNNIVAVVSGYTDLLLKDLEPESRYRESVEAIRDAGDRGRSLTRQLLAFTRQQALAPTEVDLNGLVIGMEPLLQLLLGKTVHYSSRLDPGLGTLTADPSQLEQVIMNLAVNAIDAMPDGGALTIETSNANVTGTSADFVPALELEPGRYVVLSVSDTGRGMSAETRLRLFEPFFTTKPIGHGTGLGLSTVIGVVQQGDGAVWVHSEPDTGTTFRVFLPVTRVAPQPPTEAAVEPAATGKGESVLLVEHDPALLWLLSTALGEGGYTVIPVSSGPAALRACRQRSASIDILVTDVVMPGMDGLELALALRSRRPQARLLLMSGYLGDRIDPRARHRLGASLIAKPFHAADLQREVRRLLDSAACPGAACPG